MAPRKSTSAPSVLDKLRNMDEISIIKLSDPITNSATESGARTSDASNSSDSRTTPATLEADLIHYTELFSKLRFSYVEQVTKEKFIRAIVGDPPLIVTTRENFELEQENMEAKARLKALKTEVAEMIEELERKGRELSAKHQHIKMQTTRLEELPSQLKELTAHIDDLRVASEISASADHDLNLPLGKTQDLVLQKQSQLQDITRELEALQSKLPRKRKEGERLLAELGPLETKQKTSAAAARDAKRRKEASLGGVGDDLEQRARWWRANEAVLTRLLNIQS